MKLGIQSAHFASCTTVKSFCTLQTGLQTKPNCQCSVQKVFTIEGTSIRQSFNKFIQLRQPHTTKAYFQVRRRQTYLAKTRSNMVFTWNAKCVIPENIQAFFPEAPSKIVEQAQLSSMIFYLRSAECFFHGLRGGRGRGGMDIFWNYTILQNLRK